MNIEWKCEQMLKFQLKRMSQNSNMVQKNIEDKSYIKDGESFRNQQVQWTVWSYVGIFDLKRSDCSDNREHVE